MLATLASAYFRANGRLFPWRYESDAYKLAVAEVLLQKTRADSVVPTYLRIIERYPDAIALSQADAGTLSDMLAPLGLSRKRSSMLVGMGRVVAENGPSIFHDVKSVISMVPGLGAYAARAIACFGLGYAVGIVDANVARIIRRIFGIGNPDHRSVVFQRYADALAVSSDSARDLNFGLLDIGATLCITRPRCAECPLIEACLYARRRRIIK